MEQAKKQWDLNKITGPKHIDFKVYEELILSTIGPLAEAFLNTFDNAILRGSVLTAEGEDLKKIAHVLGVADNAD